MIRFGLIGFFFFLLKGLIWLSLIFGIGDWVLKIFN